MSDDTDQDAKSEQASEQKLRKAREKGDVPVSREAGQMLAFGGMLVLAMLAGNGGMTGAVQSMGGLFSTATQVEAGGGLAGMGDLAAPVLQALAPVGILAGSALGVLLVAALLAGALQGPFVVSAERIMPKARHLSPAAGLKRIAGTDHLVDFAKSLLKLCVIGAAGLSVVWSLIGLLMPNGAVEPEWLPAMLGEGAVRMLSLVLTFVVPVAMFDVVWKRIRHLRKQRMTLQEVRDEYKESEGDPHIAGKRAQIRRQRARQRISKSVPTATLVVTNPTHYAVALRYERGIDAAPVCVAKGTDRMAARIRAIAHENAIPVIESPVLARALHAAAELDRPIPEAHWQAVARLVTFVFDLRKRIRRKPPEGARLRQPEDEIS